MLNHLLDIEQQIADLEYLNQQEGNQACYQAIVQHSDCTHLSELDELFNDMPGTAKRVLRADNRLEIGYPHFEIVLVDDDEKKVLKYTCCIINDDISINNKPTLHTAVWRPFFNSHEEIFKRLSQTTFSDYLLDKYNIMATLPNIQTHGFTFWLNRVCASRTEQLSVHGYHVNSGKIRPVTTIDQRGKEKVWLWSAENTQYRLLITAE